TRGNAVRGSGNRRRCIRRAPRATATGPTSPPACPTGACWRPPVDTQGATARAGSGAGDELCRARYVHLPAAYAARVILASCVRVCAPAAPVVTVLPGRVAAAPSILASVADALGAALMKRRTLIGLGPALYLSATAGALAESYP